MKEHNWSDEVCIYENVAGAKCSNCGAMVSFILQDEPYIPSKIDIVAAKVPLDCDKAKKLSALYEGCFGDWNGDTWLEEDYGKFVWKDK